MAKNPKTIKEKDVYRSAHEIKTAAGGLQFQEDTSVGKDGSIVPKQSAFLRLWHIGGSFLRMFHSGMRAESSGDFGLQTQGKTTITSGGDMEIRSSGDFRVYAKGNIIMLEGKQDKEQRDAAKKMAEIYEKIEKEKENAIVSTEGDEVDCEACAQEHLVNKKSGFGTRLFKTIRKFTPSYMGFSIDVLQSLYNFFIAPMLDIVSGLGLSGGEGCGNKNCKNGKIKSPQKKIEKSIEAGEKAYEKYKKDIEKYSNTLGSSNKTECIAGNYTCAIGMDMANSVNPYVDTKTTTSNAAKHEKSKTLSGAYFYRAETGGVNKFVNINPLPLMNGNYNVECAGKYFVRAGATGIDLNTMGAGSMTAGGLVLTAMYGEAVLTSSNKTIIAGKVVEISCKDGSDSSGIILNANHTRVGGGLHVDGNFTAMGSLSIDGNLCAPYLIARSMRVQTAKSGSTKLTANSAEWQTTNILTTVTDEVLQTLQYIAQPGNLIDIGAIFKTVLEKFDFVRKSTILEPNITGIAWLGYIPLPVQNFTHCHTFTPQDHVHDYTAPLGKYYSTREDWGGARTDGSNVPTPANESGDGTVPGHKTNGGACGGGGGAYGSSNSRASKARRNRNESFGIIGDNAFGDLGFVNVTPANGTFTYGPNGEILPEDKVNLSIGLECPSDLFDNTVSDDPSDSGGGSDNDGSGENIRDC